MQEGRCLILQIHNAKWVFSVITDEVKRWDPFGLVAGGAPDDEFNIEVARIQKGLPLIESPEGLAETIQTVFLKSFNNKFPLDDCMQVADKIWNRINEGTQNQ